MKLLKCPNCGTVHAVKNSDRGVLCNCANAPFRVDASENLIGFLAYRWVHRARIYAMRFDRKLGDILVKLLAMEREASGFDQ